MSPVLNYIATEPVWERITAPNNKRETVYWSCRNHPSGWRLAVKRVDAGFQWTVYSRQYDPVLKTDAIIERGVRANLHNARRSAWSRATILNNPSKENT